ncbi:hypothetical protein BOW28_11720 [Solemya velum gill symbiont]|nr:hypothetical protein BOW17_12400 [Solemya velum gill symbiont]OOY96416.1 hypothetical protein BOW19_11570 [Solemya velum gill symbiont]OOZ15462.1 hypothetical protein BOW28_11720 [Solemya velum gill symbiont]OOZ57433.1 hypothetical protein BOW43_12410 [Solemya velum gill symbiont]OOZ58400.1 hypothetical protein BOW44_13115 [Solemya velum gill symbiont]
MGCFLELKEGLSAQLYISMIYLVDDMWWNEIDGKMQLRLCPLFWNHQYRCDQNDKSEYNILKIIF